MIDYDYLTQPCQWWAACDNLATHKRAHPVLGDVPICDDCEGRLERISGEELPAAGWRFKVWYRDPHGTRRFHRMHFMHPDREHCAAEVRLRFGITHPADVVESVEWTSRIPVVETDSHWTDTFKEAKT